MLFRQLFDKDTSTFTYLLADTDSGEAVLIDTVIENVDRDLNLVAELGLRPVLVLDTHVHADHVTASGEIRERTYAECASSAVAGVSCASRHLQHGDRLRFGRYEIEARSTPGHTDGCMTYVVEADGQTMAFTGDTLLIRGCGRTDFQQGSSENLYESVHEQIFSLPDDTIIYPGHDYRGHTSSTVGEEKTHNPRLNTTVDLNEFVSIMDALDLPNPKMMDIAVPANLGCGRLPSADDDAERMYKQRGPSEIANIGDYRIVDVRAVEERVGQLGKIDGSESVPMDHLDKVEGWDREQPLLVVCRSGNRSATAASKFKKMGFKDVTNLVGGMIAWNKFQASK